jgi:hypothetical protein
MARPATGAQKSVGFPTSRAGIEWPGRWPQQTLGQNGFCPGERLRAYIRAPLLLLVRACPVPDLERLRQAVLADGSYAPRRSSVVSFVFLIAPQRRFRAGVAICGEEPRPAKRVFLI